eukprot:3280171-Amphidinium_carterae.2
MSQASHSIAMSLGGGLPQVLLLACACACAASREAVMPCGLYGATNGTTPSFSSWELATVRVFQQEAFQWPVYPLGYQYDATDAL